MRTRAKNSAVCARAYGIGVNSFFFVKILICQRMPTIFLFFIENFDFGNDHLSLNRPPCSNAMRDLHFYFTSVSPGFRAFRKARGRPMFVPPLSHNPTSSTPIVVSLKSCPRAALQGHRGDMIAERHRQPRFRARLLILMRANFFAQLALTPSLLE